VNIKSARDFRIGTAGWAIPAISREAFAPVGTQLERYASVFDGVEINSSFHRPHRISTYQRWAAAVPSTFKFSVKMPKEITHVRRLVEIGPLLDSFLAEVIGLESKLGPLLIQLPPSLAFDEDISARFFSNLRDRFAGPLALEPRNASWFSAEVELLLATFRIARVGADPAPVELARRPGGWSGFFYMRLHGSPRVYHTSYTDDAIRSALDQLLAGAAQGSDCWCIFDNTASGEATMNALTARCFIRQ
jgi:uncharacterized protein YecE (DUF72 family)